MRILILNGPNLNLLGTREPDTYGAATLSDLEESLRTEFDTHDLSFLQSNTEGVLIDAIQGAAELDGIVFNPGGYTHTSVALRDAVAGVPVPVVEVHISNVAAREPFRHTSLIAPVCIGHVAGFGLSGYRLAVLALEHHAERKRGAGSA